MFFHHRYPRSQAKQLVRTGHEWVDNCREAFADPQVANAIGIPKTAALDQLAADAGIIAWGTPAHSEVGETGTYIFPIPSAHWNNFGITVGASTYRISLGRYAAAHLPFEGEDINIVVIAGDTDTAPMTQQYILAHELTHDYDYRVKQSNDYSGSNGAGYKTMTEANAYNVAVDVADFHFDGLLRRAVNDSVVHINPTSGGAGLCVGSVDTYEGLIQARDNGIYPVLVFAAAAQEIGYDPDSAATPPPELVEFYRRFGVI